MRTIKKEEIPVVIVGCGAISRFFYVPTLRALAEPEALRVVALVDPAEENLRRLGAEFPEARCCATIEKADISPNHLVIVASPPRFHAQQSTYALHKGAAVLCEKPMADSVEAGETMVAAAGETGGILGIGLYRRFFPATETIKTLIRQQTLGPLRTFEIEEGGPFGWQAASESFFRRASTPGGVLYDTGVHTLDLLVWWLGEPEEVVYEDDAMGGLESNCRLKLAFQGGCEGIVRLSRDWKTANQYTFIFDRGFVRWTVNDANHLDIFMDGLPCAWRAELANLTKSHRRMKDGGIARTNPQSFIEQVRNIAAAKRGLQALRVPAAEGVRSLRLIQRCYENRRLMHMPWMTESELDAARRLASDIATPEIALT